MKPVIIIPAHLASTRLPDKVLLDIAGKPLLAHAWQAACQSDCGPVFIASGHQKISSAMKKIGADIIETDLNCASGSDRVLAALHQKDPQKHFDIIINLQADMLGLNPQMLRDGLDVIAQTPDADIVTPVIKINQPDHPDTVKTAIGLEKNQKSGRAFYFSRAPIPYGEGDFYKHIGLYIYRRDALEIFGKAQKTVLEQREKLEQLRALEIGLKIYGWLSEHQPFSVDNSKDLEEARSLFSDSTAS